MMRRIVQAGADFLPVDGEAGVVADASDAVLLAEHSDKSRGAGRTMLRRNSVKAGSWPERFIYAPLVARLAPMLLDRRIEAIWLRIAALILALAGAAAFWWGWLWAGLALILIAGPVDAIAGRIDLAQLRDHEGGWEIRVLKGMLQSLAILAMGGLATANTGEIVYIAFAITAVLLLILARRGGGQLRKLVGADNPYAPWLADGNAAIWLILPFAAAGYWFYWPIAVAIYAYITLFLQQNMQKEAVRQRD
ncbi:hypothetical protein [Parasphingopyxis sp.]|uniref:hypothetical protein n=1 Tax=Parasphingopyxis sp. TaxID=1920299 RepID=UPI003F9FBAB3